MKECGVCGCNLDDPADPTTKDCGGDCLRCMAEVGKDPECVAAMAKLIEKNLDVPAFSGTLDEAKAIIKRYRDNFIEDMMEIGYERDDTIIMMYEVEANRG